jgi:starch synthase
LPKTDILHLNDWQTGLVPYLLKYDPKYQSLTHIKTIFTIHNIAYQGRFAKDLMPYLNTDYSNLLEFDDVINFLKTGIMTADHVTTVSPTYKDQLQHAYFAYGMQGMLKLRSQSFTGILNGLDFNEFNPENDTALIKNYALKTVTAGKKANKKDLMDAFGLKNPNLPLFGMVSRITEAKGFDLVADVIPPLVEKGLMNFVLLGSGDPYFEQTFQYFKDQYPHHFGVYFGYSDGMARQIYAGSDFFLMPSRFEPCGLAQMISMRYGTLPVVHKTGGLKDTVEPFNEYTIEGTGFGFDTYQADDLKQAVLSAINVYGQPDIYKTLQKRAMQQDFSWESSASLYEELYQSLRG